MKIKLKKLHPNAKLPHQASEGAGAFDLYCTEVEQVESGFVKCKTGLAMEIPQGYRLMLIPRSSIGGTGWVLSNSQGLIDSDYRGEVQAWFRAVPYVWIYSDSLHHLTKVDIYPFPYAPGDRICQVYLEKVIPTEWEEVEELSDTVRGEGGFGHTGK